MKKILLFLLTVVCVFSCTKNEFETYDIQKVRETAFEQDFNTAFGVTAADYANQKWGMEYVPMVVNAQTRAAQPNGNQWGTHDDNDKYLDYPAPAAITEQELADVLAVFNEKGKTSYDPLVHWKNFFVQQVYTGPNGAKMNELASTVDYTVTTNVISWWPYEAETIVTQVSPFDDIINNFNAGTCTAWDGCMLMWNSATEDFSFKTSQGGGERWYKHWRMEEINGNYYVGFDHESAKQGSEANENELDVRDYIYNDWIVKIVPGKGEIIPQPIDRVRVMCEDLGVEHSDFDYNDIVFDVKFVKNGTVIVADIFIQAAGGTLPLYIGGQEVHGLFGESIKEDGTYPMINTGAGPSHDPVHLNVTLSGSYDNAWNAINALNVYIYTKDGQKVTLTVNPGSPAEMFACPTTVHWSGERVSIKNKYPKFATWISDPTVKWWE